MGKFNLFFPFRNLKKSYNHFFSIIFFFTISLATEKDHNYKSYLIHFGGFYSFLPLVFLLAETRGDVFQFELNWPIAHRQSSRAMVLTNHIDIFVVNSPPSAN